MNTLKFILAVFFSIILSTAFSQEFSVAGKYNRSDLTQFQTGIGGEVSIGFYDKFENRLNISGSIAYRGKPYEYSFFSDAIGDQYYRYVEPDNYLFSIGLSYDWPILKTSASAMYIGLNLSLNSFSYNETGNQHVEYQSIMYDYLNNTTEDFNPGIGLNFEFERAFSDDGTFIYFAFQPSIVKYYKFNMIGTSKPSLIDLINYKIGIRFNRK